MPDQWLFTSEEVLYAPSIASGLNPPTELHNRGLAVRRIWDLKDLLNVPTNVAATSAVYIHRFYMRETMQAHAWPMLAAAAFFLAAKVEEQPRRLRDIVGISNDLEANRIPIQSNGRYSYIEDASDFITTKKKILFYEGILLTRLCFDLNIIHPGPIMIKACRIIWNKEKEKYKEIERTAWMFLSDSLYGTSCLTQRVEVLAAAAIAFACEQLRIPFPTPPNESSPLPLMEEGEEIEPFVSWLDRLKVSPEELTSGMAALSSYHLAADDFIFQQSTQLIEAPKLKAKSLNTILSTVAPLPFLSTVAPPPFVVDPPTAIAPSIISSIVPEIPTGSTTPPLTPIQLPTEPTSLNTISDVDMFDGTTSIKVEAPEKVI